MNVITVDWRDIANKNYVTAKAGVPVVGKALGLFVDWLGSLQTSYDQIHLVGFSLGAHVVGNAGRIIGPVVKRITGKIKYNLHQLLNGGNRSRNKENIP